MMSRIKVNVAFCLLFHYIICGVFAQTTFLPGVDDLPVAETSFAALLVYDDANCLQLSSVWILALARHVRGPVMPYPTNQCYYFATYDPMYDPEWSVFLDCTSNPGYIHWYRLYPSGYDSVELRTCDSSLLQSRDTTTTECTKYHEGPQYWKLDCNYQPFGGITMPPTSSRPTTSPSEAITSRPSSQPSILVDEEIKVKVRVKSAPEYTSNFDWFVDSATPSKFTIKSKDNVVLELDSRRNFDVKVYHAKKIDFFAAVGNVFTLSTLEIPPAKCCSKQTCHDGLDYCKSCN
jgi:hypothetical protein